MAGVALRRDLERWPGVIHETHEQLVVTRRTARQNQVTRRP